MVEFKVCSIEITSKCPCSCQSCYYKIVKPKKAFMNLENFKAIIDRLPKTIKRLQLSGGEPMLHPLLHSMCLYATEKLVKPVIFTSGASWSRKEVVRLISCVEGFKVTLKYPNKQDDEFKGVNGAFESARNLLCLLKKNHVRSWIHWVADKKNANFFEDMKEMADRYSAELELLKLG